MGLVPTQRAVIGKFINGRNATDDFLQLADNHGGTVFGWIDADGIRQGSLAGGGGGGGVTSLNTLTGDIIIAAGTNISIVPSGNTLTINSVGTISGTIASTQVAFGSSSNVITGDSQFIWSNVHHSLNIGPAYGVLPIPVSLGLPPGVVNSGIFVQKENTDVAGLPLIVYGYADSGAGDLGIGSAGYSIGEAHGTTQAVGWESDAEVVPGIGQTVLAVNKPSATGLLGVAANSGVGTANFITGVWGNVQSNIGTTVWGSSLYAAENIVQSGGTLTNNVGVYLDAQSAGTNNYGLYVEDFGTSANNWAIFVQGSKSFIGGSLNVGPFLTGLPPGFDEQTGTASLVATGNVASGNAAFLVTAQGSVGAITGAFIFACPTGTASGIGTQVDVVCRPGASVTSSASGLQVFAGGEGLGTIGRAVGIQIVVGNLDGITVVTDARCMWLQSVENAGVVNAAGAYFDRQAVASNNNYGAYFEGDISDVGTKNWTIFVQAGQSQLGNVVSIVGSTSGSAAIGTAAVAGTPHQMNLPTSTGSAGQVLTTDGGNPQQLTWSSVSGTGTVTSVGMAGDGVIFNSTVTNSPVTSSGTLTPVLLTHAQNLVLAGPASGSAAAPTFRALVALDIPAIPASQLSNGVTGTGAVVLAVSPALTGSPTAPTQISSDNTTKLATTAFVQSVALTAGAVTSVFGRAGVVVAATNDYSFSQISGSVAASQLPNPTVSTLGGVEAIVAVSHKWINAINTSGVPQLTQPDMSDLTGSISLAQTVLTTLGDILYVNSSPALARLAGNTTTVKKYLSQTGTSVVSAAPAWAQIAAADLSDGATGTGAIVLAVSPTLTGSPLAPTAAITDSSTKIATTAFVKSQKYANTFGSSTTWSIPGATHGLGTADLLFTIFDSATGTRTVIVPDSVTVDSTVFDVTVTFVVAQAGRIVISAI